MALSADGSSFPRARSVTPLASAFTHTYVMCVCVCVCACVRACIFVLPQLHTHAHTRVSCACMYIALVVPECMYVLTQVCTHVTLVFPRAHKSDLKSDLLARTEIGLRARWRCRP